MRGRAQTELLGQICFETIQNPPSAPGVLLLPWSSLTPGCFSRQQLDQRLALGVSDLYAVVHLAEDEAMRSQCSHTGLGDGKLQKPKLCCSAPALPEPGGAAMLQLGSSAAKTITAASAEQPRASIPCGGVGNPSSFPPLRIQARTGPRGSWDLPELTPG